MADLAELVETKSPSHILVVRALGEKSAAALDSEVNLLGYLSPMTNQQIMLAQQNHGVGWRLTPAAIGGIEFRDCLLSRKGELALPRLQGGLLAAISHPWSGLAEIETEQGTKRVDLYSELPRAIVIDTGNGVVREIDPKDAFIFREMFKDALSNPDLIDHRESGVHRQPSPISEAFTEHKLEEGVDQQALGWVTVRATGEWAAASIGKLVMITEVELVAGLFADLGRLEWNDEWRIETRAAAGDLIQTVLTSNKGTLRLCVAQSGSVAFLCGPEAGIVELDIFGTPHRLDLYHHQPRLLRVNFDTDGALPYPAGAFSLQRETLRQRRDFYTAVLAKIDPSKPVGLYVPRWKGVAASTKNLFDQTLPFPHTSDGHPSDVMPEDVKFCANTLLASGARHFIVSGGDTFWISVIRRVQREDPGVRFDLLWHSNYLQMGEPHDWNLLKNWLRAIADGLVTRVAVVKEGLEQLFRKLGVDTVFIPNVIHSDPSEIRYNGIRDLVGIWLSGSSSYRKVPYAALLALKSLERTRLIGAGFDDDSLAMVTEMRVPRADIWREPLPQEALYRNIQRTSLTFYITLSECSPMLPLESMHLGVPALVGPCSHLFRTDTYLYKMLVVENPLSPEVIARHARRALAEGQQIIDAYIEYSYREQKQAADGLTNLLS